MEPLARAPLALGLLLHVVGRNRRHELGNRAAAAAAANDVTGGPTEATTVVAKWQGRKPLCVTGEERMSFPRLHAGVSIGKVNTRREVNGANKARRQRQYENMHSSSDQIRPQASRPALEAAALTRSCERTRPFRTQ